MLVELTKMGHRPIEGLRTSWRRFSQSWALHDHHRLLAVVAVV